jgi:hypothetical protein
VLHEFERRAAAASIRTADAAVVDTDELAGLPIQLSGVYTELFRGAALSLRCRAARRSLARRDARQTGSVDEVVQQGGLWAAGSSDSGCSVDRRGVRPS